MSWDTDLNRERFTGTGGLIAGPKTKRVSLRCLPATGRIHWPSRNPEQAGRAGGKVSSVPSSGMNLDRRHRLQCLGGLALLVTTLALSQRDLGVRPDPSGGVLSPEQATFDLRYAALDLSIDPSRRSLQGSATLEVRILHPSRTLVLDLDQVFQVSSVLLLEGEAPRQLSFERRGGQIWVEYPWTRQPGDTVRVRVDYGGKPREAPRPPWVGGFVWDRTADGSPWVGVACQMDGADLWWPVKDHPSDEPERMDLAITVPTPLVVASNGVLRRVEDHADGTHTFHWHISNPINAYNVTVNVAPYRTITRTYQSTAGEEIPVTYWVLPENYQRGLQLFDQFLEHLRFLEEKLGPYPFRNEKYGVAETSYLGMEHQTIISYGNRYQNNEYGFDALHLHELAHEWWGNLVSAADWRDHWLHEGFASYMEALYAETLQGRQALHSYLAALRPRIRNLMPVAPREPQTMMQKYFVPPDYTRTDGDVNFKGAWILHTLRYLVGEEAFGKILRRFAYPEARLEQITGGEQCRFASTEDFRRLCEEISGQDLSWFFEVYLRQPELPRLQKEWTGQGLHLRWVVPGDRPFPMPVEIHSGATRKRLVLPDSGIILPAASPEEVQVDPEEWILKAHDRKTVLPRLPSNELRSSGRLQASPSCRSGRNSGPHGVLPHLRRSAP